MAARAVIELIIYAQLRLQFMMIKVVRKENNNSNMYVLSQTVWIIVIVDNICGGSLVSARLSIPKRKQLYDNKASPQLKSNSRQMHNFSHST